MEKAAAVEFKNVHKKFGEGSEVLKNLNLAIPSGQITVVIGFSGAGKSVMLKHILGLLQPDKGSISVLGEDLSKLSERNLNELRKRFGMLFQSAALFDDMTAYENVTFPIEEFRPGVTKKELKDQVEHLFQLVGLRKADYAKYPSELSGGMRKRVGLARALALEPEVLLYDEPTTGLDPVITEMVDNLILETHHHRKGLTTIIISHDLPAAFRLGDHIAMLDEGKIRLFGTPQDFFDTDDPLIKKFVSKARELKHS